MTSIFAQPPKPAGTGLFGSAAAPPTSSVFNASATQPPGTGLFGSAAPTQSTGLFGASTQAPTTSSLFGASQPATGLFGASTPQVQNFAGSLGQGLNASTGVGAMNAQTQREMAQSRLQGAGLNASTREKTVEQQVETLVNKWNPANSSTLLQTHLYNVANPAFAPFYHPDSADSEKDFEAALAKKPEDVDGNTWVPVLVRGFQALGERVEYQARFVQNMRVRLHEMNNALTAIMQKHSQDLSVRVDKARRQHATISARTLNLAVKCQMLRNRGYALDAQEEGLRTTLSELEKNVQDPSYHSREQEIWGKMLALRDRARWLEEEGKRLGGAATEGQQQGIADHVVVSCKRILRDYDAQIQQLSKEVGEIQNEYNDWAAGRGL